MVVLVAKVPRMPIRNSVMSKRFGDTQETPSGWSHYLEPSAMAAHSALIVLELVECLSRLVW